MNRHEILYAHRRLRVAGKTLTRFPLEPQPAHIYFPSACPFDQTAVAPTPLSFQNTDLSLSDYIPCLELYWGHLRDGGWHIKQGKHTRFLRGACQ